MCRRSFLHVVVRTFLVTTSALAVCASASASSGKDSRVQNRLYDHLDSAERAMLYGHVNEATAYAEMVLLKREITVYVDDTNVPWQIKDDAKQALRDAAVNWEDALNREIRFRFVPFNDADVVVRYADGVRHDGKDAAGTVRWSRQVMSLGSEQFHYQVTANVALRTYTPNGARMNRRQMLHTAGHELGHILGLEDSARHGDVMGPLRLDRPVERATRDERNSLLALRRQADLILQRATGTVAEVPEDYSHITLLVVSDAAALIEPEENSARDSGGQRRPAPVRRPRRDRQASARASHFTINGMAE